MKVTRKQISALQAIKTEIGEEPRDLNQVMDRLYYETSKSSFQFTLRLLIKNGHVEKGEIKSITRPDKYGRVATYSRRTLHLTESGLNIVAKYTKSNVDMAAMSDDIDLL